MPPAPDFTTTLAAAKQGEPDAIEAIYRDLSPVVLGYLRANGAREPEELTGDVFVGMLEGIGRFEGDWLQFRSWTMTIAHRRLVDSYRRQARHTEAPIPADTSDQPLIDLTDHENQALARLRAKGILSAIDRLSEAQRAVLLLRVVADLPVREVAKIVGKPETAVKALQRRALLSLDRVLKGDPDRWQDTGGDGSGPPQRP